MKVPLELRNSLSTRVIEFDCDVDKLKVENSLLLGRVDVLGESMDTSNVDPLVESLTSSLSKIISFQKSYGDKCGLGLVHNAYCSKGAPINKGKMNFVPSFMLLNNAPRIDSRARRVWVDIKSSDKSYGLKVEGSKRS
ncbi:hypothetical protein SLA2020_284430 [Shorea laevis]